MDDDDEFKRLLLSLPRDLLSELPLVYHVPLTSLSDERRLHFYETNKILTDNPELGRFIVIKFNTTPISMNLVDCSISYEYRLPSESSTPENLIRAIEGIEDFIETQLARIEAIRCRV